MTLKAVANTGSGGGTGTVTSVSVTTANGVSGVVANSTTTPAITLTLGAITPSSISTGGQITSTLAIGTAPLVITSTTLVPNLYVARAVVADSATTNANLTGPITSVGNATSIASQTGTGTKFVVDTSPTLVTPNIGVATGTSLALNGATIGSNSIAGVGQFASYGATTTSPGFYAYLNGDTFARVRIGLDANDTPSLAFGPGSASTRDAFIIRVGAANIQLGQSAVDTGPINQTLQTQGVITGSGTSNVAGANLTIASGQGKGNATGSVINLQAPLPVASGTGAQTMTTGWQVGSGGGYSPNGAVASPSHSFINSMGTGFWFVNSTMGWSGGGTFGGYLYNGGAILGDNGQLSWLTVHDGSNVFTRNNSLTSGGVGVLRLGLADAAVAVPQTISVQSVVAGTTAANGANWTLIGSLPTGTGTSGDIIVQTGVKTGSGTTQGTPTTALTIKGETQTVLIASGKQLQLGNSAVTGLVAGALAALTNATITLTDSTGQVYRIPCII